MPRSIAVALCTCLGFTLPAMAADAAYAVKEAKTALPEGLKEPIAKAMGERSFQFLDAKGNVLCELWFCKEVPAKATAEQIKNGLTYRELQEGTLLGVVRFPNPITDRPGAIDLTDPKGEIRFDHVSFAYPAPGEVTLESLENPLHLTGHLTG